MKNPHLDRIGRQIGLGEFRRISGFTLTELMVVIVIIVVLAAMTFMGASRMKEKARSAVCASNIRQVGMAMLSYTSDNQNKLPPLAKIDPRTGKQSGIWTLVLARDGYLWDPQTPGTPRLNEGVWACPECTESSNITHMGYGIAEATVIQYDDRVSRANTRLGKTEFGSLRLTSIKNPSRTWLLGDAALKPDKLEESWYAVWSNPTKWGSGHTPAERHGGKVNVCMVDGHVESLTIDQIKEGNYTLDQ
jgi:prepilin-type processing-associated H-X9-DG protein/prepilin-type N-terminal cleavage/methylation domain-containing protein